MENTHTDVRVLRVKGLQTVSILWISLGNFSSKNYFGVKWTNIPCVTVFFLFVIFLHKNVAVLLYMKEISFWWLHWVKGVTMSYRSGDPIFESHVLWKNLHMCKRSVWLKRSCTSNALFFSIILHARIVIIASQSLIMLRIKDRVLSQDRQLTLEQYCTWHTVALITFVPSLTVILWLTLFNASATLLPSTKKAEDSPLKEWNYKNNVFP